IITPCLLQSITQERHLVPLAFFVNQRGELLDGCGEPKRVEGDRAERVGNDVSEQARLSVPDPRLAISGAPLGRYILPVVVGFAQAIKGLVEDPVVFVIAER